jgi:hypothetical protein
MSQAEALLNSMSEEVPMHTHPVPDTDTYFVIDPITRKIENTNRKKNVIMQYDHNSERFTFELPRYIDGHDMLECTSVTVNVDNVEIGVEEPRVNSDAPDMTDLRSHPNDPDKVISSWLISRNSTQLAGILSFHIEFKCVDSSGNVVYEWSTDNFDEIEVRARKKNGESAVAEHTDLLEQWRTRIFGAGDSVMANIAAEGVVQVAAVQVAAGDLMEVAQSKGDAIVCEVSGESIVLEDSSNDYLRGMRVFGKSTQDGAPTPENPKAIESVNITTINVDAQSMALNYTLPGIPVTSGGNYTDSDGQQWICDEVDLERGVYVQRIKKFVLSALKTDTWRTWGVSKNTDGITGFYHYFTDSVILDFVLCNIGVYGSQTWGGVKSGVGASAGSKYLTVSLNNECLADVSSDEKAIESLQTLLSETNATMLAAIEPIETPLTAEEITAYKALRTNYPNTTILNDAGAWMSVKYNADTKTYVENPKVLKLVDSSTGVVYELKIVDGNLTVNPV